MGQFLVILLQVLPLAQGRWVCSLVGTSNNSSPHNPVNDRGPPAGSIHCSLATYNGPISRDLINYAAGNSTNCKTFAFELMDGMYDKQLASSSFSGGVGKYKGVTTFKQALSPNNEKYIQAPQTTFPHWICTGGKYSWVQRSHQRQIFQIYFFKIWVRYRLDIHLPMGWTTSKNTIV